MSSSLAFYKAIQIQDIEIAYLLNMGSEDGRYSRSHGVSSRLLKLQAETIGIPIVQRKSTWESYEQEFKKAVSDLKRENIQAGVFGDIDIQGHRDWIERVCKETGIKPVLPLWKEKRKKLLNEFIHAGFKAVVVCANSKFLGKDYLGKEIDKRFMEV